MATCIRCGRKGLFFKVDANGRCESCASAYKQERSSKPKSEPIVHKPKSPLASVFDLKRPGQTLRYKYTDVKVHCPVIYPAPILRIGQICGMIRDGVLNAGIPPELGSDGFSTPAALLLGLFGIDALPVPDRSCPGVPRE